MTLFECSLTQKVLSLQYNFYSLSVPTLTVSTKLLALNILSIALYTFKNFNNIYILQNYLSCHALKIKVLKNI